MVGAQSLRIRLWVVVALFVLPLFHTMVPAEFDTDEESSPLATQGRAQTIWSGTRTVASSYTVSVSDELIIQGCTTVEFAAGARLYVEGRLTVQGNTSCPVVLEASGSGQHNGLQFNSSSSGRGSLVQHLVIEDAIYGVTVYGADPVLENITVVNPSRVGVDLFSGASPRISDLTVDRAGRELPSQTDWRYGLGLSVGSGSTPIVERATLTDMLTRAVNVWGGSGGLFNDLTINNITGSSWVMVAGVWVEDSQPLLTNITIDTSDNGMVIRHIDDGGYTHAVGRHITISNAMYRGVYVDKNNHTNYTNYETADFTNLTVRGTATSGALTANIGFAAIDVNATGAWFEDTLVEDSTTVGVRLFFVDSTTTFRNLTIRDSGDPGQGPHEAGLAIRSSDFAPVFDGLEISGSVGPGIASTTGGAMQGTQWHLHNNSHQGLSVDRAEVQVRGLELHDNGRSGAKITDARSILLENLTARNNGGDTIANPFPENQAGLYFEDSNDVETSRGDVRCRNCTVSGSTGVGVMAMNSVDFWLEGLNVHANAADQPGVVVDNLAVQPAGATGRIHMSNAAVATEAVSEPAIKLIRVAANIDGLTTSGNNTGVEWRGDNNGQLPSTLRNSILSGTGCLTLTGHSQLTGEGNTIGTDCLGSIQLVDSHVNWSRLVDALGQSSTPAIIELDATSTLHLHQPSQVSLTDAVLANGAEMDVAWDMVVWVVNNYSNGVPNAAVNVSFSQIEPSVTLRTDDLGQIFLPNFIGQRWTSSGPSAYTVVTTSCGYDSTSNSTVTTLDDDENIYCLLPLDNQAPFLRWTSPEDSSIFPSQAEVEFNATETWDLDNDTLTFSWRSSINGLFSSSSDVFLVNNASSGSTLSDGLHTITLEVCDPSRCVSETRTIELVNLPPVLSLEFEPSLNPWSELIMPQTGTVTINTTGTYDPEGDDFACIIMFSGYNRQGIGWGNQWECSEELTYTFDHVDDEPPASFTMTIQAWDRVGNNATYSVPVMLYNELPQANFTVERTGNDSAANVTFNGSTTVDAEGDQIRATYTSSLDGLLSNDGLVWTGHLSRGVHAITMEVTDERPEHINRSTTSTIQVTVDNTVPVAVIQSPPEQTFDSSELLWFSANGSGDFDAACGTFPMDGEWLCAPNEPAGGSEFLVVVWESNIDGRLTPEDEDWLIFDSRLSAGVHTLTLLLDDGINEPVTTTRTVTITPSAPVLGLVAPANNTTHLSSTILAFDASQSVDHDGDPFTVTLRSSLLNDPLLTAVDPNASHNLSLPAGEHTMTVTLEDSTGLSRDEMFVLQVVESAPVLVMNSPTNRESIEPGGDIVLSESSFDADNDLTVREWRWWSPDTSAPEVISTRSQDVLEGWAPGEYHFSLFVEDARGYSVEEHVNITLQSSLPRLVSESLVLSTTKFTQNQLNVLTIRIQLDDADGTTDDVRANITLGVQQWEINLTDTNGDNVWEGTIEWRPENEGRPSFRIIARDGTGEGANIDMLSRTLVVEAPAADARGLMLVAFGAVTVMMVGLVALLVVRRRRAMEDIEVLTSWEAFRAPMAQVKPMPELPSVDGTEEVMAQMGEGTEPLNLDETDSMDGA